MPVTRRQFLAASGLAALAGPAVIAKLLLPAAGGGTRFVITPDPDPDPGDWQITGAAALETGLAAVFAAAASSVVVAGVTQEEAFEPDAGHGYDAIWTRDHCYAIWHNPTLYSSAQIQQFVTHRLATRSVSPPDFIADRISTSGSVTYKNGGQLPFMDGIAFLVLAVWTDWNETGDDSYFLAHQSDIDDCIAATPRSVNGCVWSDPANPSCYYGFTDAVNITGDMAMGTAMHAWAYKMLDEISGGGSSTAEGDTYANLRAHAESGLATLRQGNGFYQASNTNSVGKDDVWCTALAVAEELVSGTDRTDSAQALADAYLGGDITENGWVRHLPDPQTWPDIAPTAGTYQNGGYWLTPIWDCVRAVDLVDSALARTWAAQAIQEVADQYTAEGSWLAVPWEWRHTGATGNGGVKGYTASAAIVHRFI